VWISVLAAFAPTSAVLILAIQRAGSRGARKLVKRAVDVQRIQNKAWLIIALLLAPLNYCLSNVVMRWSWAWYWLWSSPRGIPGRLPGCA